MEVPSEIETERGQLVDLLIDSHQYTYKKKVAIFGDPDVVLGLTSLALEMSMIPKYIITGTPREAFTESVKALLEKYNVAGECTVKAGTDLFKLHQWIKNEPVDMLIGSSYGKQIARAEDIPFVRVGFPVIDRYGGTLLPIVGYAGGIRLAEKIVNTMLDRFDRDVADEDFELVL
jgi:nitrogenase molybdenum-iron protein beta chain